MGPHTTIVRLGFRALGPMLSSLTTPMWKGRNLLAQTQEALESGAREPSGQGVHDAYHFALPGGPPHSVAPSDLGNHDRRSASGGLQGLCSVASLPV
jgi:hypothetical protein